jgi:hypothetical protein
MSQQSASRRGSTPKPPKEAREQETLPQEDEVPPQEEKPKASKVAPKMWLDPVNPEVPPNWEFLLSRGYIQSIKVEFTSFGKSVVVGLQENSPTGPIVVTRSARDALSVLKRNGILDKYGRVPDSLKKIQAPPGTPATAGAPGGAKRVATQLPKRALVGADLEAGLAALQIRAASVGSQLSLPTFRGRILSLFRPEPSRFTTVEQWWASAAPEARFRVLSEQQKLDVVLGSEQLSRELNALMPNVLCPFRGALAPQKGSSGQAKGTDSFD